MLPRWMVQGSLHKLCVCFCLKGSHFRISLHITLVACVRSSNMGEHTGQQAWLRRMMLRAHDGARSDSKDNDKDMGVDERIFGLLITHCFAHVLGLDCERASDDDQKNLNRFCAHVDPMSMNSYFPFSSGSLPLSFSSFQPGADPPFLPSHCFGCHPHMLRMTC
jgi:hypothetical protein